eukprot:11882507-Ditylum_brightwellii.AAC.1
MPVVIRSCQYVQQNVKRKVQNHADKFSHLVCLFDALYKKANRVIVRKADGTLKTFLQYEGFVQGCPLSGIFAAAVCVKIPYAIL